MLKKNIKVFCCFSAIILVLSSCATVPSVNTSYNIKEFDLNQYSNTSDYHYIMAFTYFYNNNIKEGIKEYELFLKDNPKKHFFIEFVNLLIRFQDFNKAQEVLQTAIEKYPKDNQLYLLLSDIYVIQKQYQKAIDVLVKSGIKTFDVYKNIAILYAQLGDINNAINYLMQARQFSDKGEVYFYISQVYYKFNLDNNALNYLQMSASYKYPKAYIALGDLYAQHNDYTKALKYYEDFLKLPNKNKEEEVYVYTALASIYYSIDKDLKKAIEYYKKAYNLDKSQVNLERLSYLLLQNKNYKETVDLLSNNPDIEHSPTLRYFLGVAYFSLKNYKQALLELSNVDFASDLYTDAQAKKALCYLELKEPQKAIEAIQKAIELNPNEELYKTYFYILNQQKDWNGLIDALKQSTKIIKDKEKIYFYLADVYYNKKHDKQKTIHFLNEALRINPNDPEVLNYLGYLYIDENIDVKAGIDMVKKALKLQPNNPYYLDSLGWGYFKEKRFKLAQYYLERANRLLKKPESTIALHLAKVYEALGYKSKAKKIAIEVLKNEPNNETAKKIIKALK
ncbi:Tetratricopeptide repeat-containing protein [Desulfurella multipotens]|uniref:beta-lactamase n=1 Tax=Desulfurella multipotens TaxID=79269 RepID=A0A1G6K2C0_9BACT|nr:tetratricopeptide repeat protein [Desulfurella multipotens]SDC25097.1 Tetratricopeptide repeat-containing protein [Desulfurella multipotens]